MGTRTRSRGNVFPTVDLEGIEGTVRMLNPVALHEEINQESGSQPLPCQWLSYKFAPAPLLERNSTLKKYETISARIQKQQQGSPDQGRDLLRLEKCQQLLRNSQPGVYYISMSMEDQLRVFAETYCTYPTVHISVSLLEALHSGIKSDWLSLPFGEPNTAGELKWLRDKEPWKEIDYELDLLESTVPVRLSDGRLAYTMLRLDEGRIPVHAWHQLFHSKLSRNEFATKPPRHSEFDLESPLKIMPRPFHKPLVLRCVAKLQSMYIKQGKQWVIEYSETVKEDPDYMLHSLDPFGIFFTYISRRDWSKWMEHFGEHAPGGLGSTRPFITTATNEMVSCITKLTTDAEGRYENLGPERQKKLDDEVKELTKQGKIGKVKIQAMARRTLARQAIRKNIRFEKTSRSMVCYIAPSKIKAARNMRTGEDKQETVMGGVPAPKIASSLKWPDDAKFSNAEWVHLLGFAYGGFGLPDTLNEWSTSQTPYNLVFGTSETNSLMTRYETAWQSLMVRERFLDLYEVSAKRHWYGDHLDKEPPDAILEIYTNQPDDPVYYDVFDAAGQEGHRYSRASYPIWWTGDVDSEYRHPFQGTADPGGMLNDLRQVTKDHFYIVQSIRYKIDFNRRSRLLWRPKFTHVEHFYPFSRPLLHKAEVDMDKAIMDELWVYAKRGLGEELAQEFGIAEWGDGSHSIKIPGEKGLYGKNKTQPNLSDEPYGNHKDNFWKAMEERKSKLAQSKAMSFANRLGESNEDDTGTKTGRNRDSTSDPHLQTHKLLRTSFDRFKAQYGDQKKAL